MISYYCEYWQTENDVYNDFANNKHILENTFLVVGYLLCSHYYSKFILTYKYATETHLYVDPRVYLHSFKLSHVLGRRVSVMNGRTVYSLWERPLSIWCHDHFPCKSNCLLTFCLLMMIIVLVWCLILEKTAEQYASKLFPNISCFYTPQ